MQCPRSRQGGQIYAAGGFFFFFFYKLELCDYYQKNNNNRRGDNNFIIAIKRTNSAVIATLQRSHVSLPELIFLSHSSVESRD